MSVRFAVALVTALAVSWAIAGPAAALERGVFVDPGSPAGKEYGVPLSVLRGAASGHAPVGNQSPPLFGIGVSPPGGRGATSSHATPRGEPQQSRHGHATGGRRGARATPPGGAAAAGAGAAGAGAAGGGAAGAAPLPRSVLAGITRHGSAIPAVSLLGGLVLLGGLAFGAALVAARRRLD